MSPLAKAAVLQGLLLAIQTLLYFGIEIFEKNPRNVKRSWDQKIPFIPASVFVYNLWFPLIALFPLALFCWETELYPIYLSAIAADILLSTLCYWLYPTSFQRPVPPETFSGRVLRWVYRGSYKGLNCAPSMHCSMCYIILYFALVSRQLPLIAVLLSALLSLGIVLSTLLTRQHVLIDALSALPMAALCLLFAHGSPLYSALSGLR